MLFRNKKPKSKADLTQRDLLNELLKEQAKPVSSKGPAEDDIKKLVELKALLDR